MATAGIDAVRQLLTDATDGQETEVAAIAPNTEIVGCPLGYSYDVARVPSAQETLQGTGWTAYVAEVSEPSGLGGVVHRMTEGRERFAPGTALAASGKYPTSPDIGSVITAARQLTDRDIDNHLAALQRDDNAWTRKHMDLELDIQLASTRQRNGQAPSVAAIPFDARRNAAALDRWLMAWELEQDQPPQVGDEFPDWILNIGDPILVAIPWAEPEAVLAADDFWGAPPLLLVALLSRWHARYGTRVVSLAGNGLALLSETPPNSVKEAHEIARAIDLISNNLIGAGGAAEARRAYAYGLMTSRRWWLAGMP